MSSCRIARRIALASGIRNSSVRAECGARLVTKVLCEVHQTFRLRGVVVAQLERLAFLRLPQGGWFQAGVSQVAACGGERRFVWRSSLLTTPSLVSTLETKQGKRGGVQ